MPMIKLARLPFTALLSSLTVLSAMSCAPSIQELNLSQEVVDNLPKEQALSFLQSLQPSPQGYVQCLFDQDGVARWIPQQGQLLPGKNPYASLDARPERPGIMRHYVATAHDPARRSPENPRLSHPQGLCV